MTLQELKDKFAQELGYADYVNIENTDLEPSEKESIQLSILELVVTYQNATIEELRATIVNSDTYKELMAITLERDKLKEEIQYWKTHIEKKDEVYHTLKESNQAEIQTLKEERDRFAVGFAKFCQVDLRGRTFKDLLEEFKNVSKKE